MSAGKLGTVLVAVTVLCAVVFWAGCKRSGMPADIPPPHFSSVPEVDASALEGKVKDLKAEMGKGRYQILIRGVAVEDLGTAPQTLTAEMLDAGGSVLGSAQASLVLDPMPKDANYPPIPAGSKIVIGVGVSSATQDTKKIVLTEGGALPTGPGAGAPGPGESRPPAAQ